MYGTIYCDVYCNGVNVGTAKLGCECRYDSDCGNDTTVNDYDSLDDMDFKFGCEELEFEVLSELNKKESDEDMLVTFRVKNKSGSYFDIEVLRCISENGEVDYTVPDDDEIEMWLEDHIYELELDETDFAEDEYEPDPDDYRD